MIELKSISKSYGKESVLTDFNYIFEKGITTAIIGPSGCGKSTLLRIIMGLIQKDDGKVLIDNEEVTKENILQIRQSIGYVIQKGGLFPHLSAYDNCALVAKHLGWKRFRINERLEELCALTKIKFENLSKKPGSFSGGQQQRIALIRALMLDPEILLLDEPLGSIDPLVRFELQTDLKKIFEDLNKTVLLVTHDLGEAGFLGDQVILLNNGEVAQSGGVKEILKNPKNEFVERFIKAQRNHLEEV